MPVLDMIYARGFSAYLHGIGAIDTWLSGNFVPGKIANGFIHILTTADVTELAKLFDELRYPGVDLADAALDEDDRTWYFRCVDSIIGQQLSSEQQASFTLLDFYRDCKTNVCYDPRGIYPLLKVIRKNVNSVQRNNAAEADSNFLHNIFSEGFNPNIEYNQALTDAALILSRYFSHDFVTEKDIRKIAAQLTVCHTDKQEPCKEEQRIFLSGLITSPNPGLGFELLKASGYIKNFWPELAILEQADHSKEFHPEGNAWEHTMETFRHRKPGALNSRASGSTGAFDIRLSLGLLLHDIGKPLSTSTGNHRYESHAELGEIQARRFLERLGFNASMTRDICFLVRNHMLPAALPRLPLFRTEQIMSSDLFPLLMELYRCDESSSFKGLDGYYESSAAYQQFLRNKRNPYRTADGKKLNRKKSGG